MIRCIFLLLFGSYMSSPLIQPVSSWDKSQIASCLLCHLRYIADNMGCSWLSSGTIEKYLPNYRSLVWLPMILQLSVAGSLRGQNWPLLSGSEEWCILSSLSVTATMANHGHRSTCAYTSGQMALSSKCYAAPQCCISSSLERCGMPRRKHVMTFALPGWERSCDGGPILWVGGILTWYVPEGILNSFASCSRRQKTAKTMKRFEEK